MKKFYLSLLCVFITLGIAFSQVPEAFSYQAVVRNSSGDVVANQNVSFRINILLDSDSGTSVYSETHSVTTNTFGLANLKIGLGTVESGTFNPAGWSDALHFIKVEIDPNGGTSFNHLGTTQLVSVPYAFHAETAVTAENVTNDQVDDSDADPTNEIQTLSISGTQLSLSDGGGTVTLPSSGGGDNWGTQTVETDATLDGDGTTSNPLTVVGDLTDDQTLSISGNELSISDGNTVLLPSSENLWEESTDGIQYNSGKVGINHDPADDEAYLQIDGENLPAIEAMNNSATYPALFAQNNSGNAGYFMGTIQIKDGTQGIGKVLTSDANGLASWQSPGSSSSSLWEENNDNIFYLTGKVGIGKDPGADLRQFQVKTQSMQAIGGENSSSYATLYLENLGSGPAAQFKNYLKIQDGTEGIGKVLTSDENGATSWQPVSSLWSQTGNNIYFETGYVGIGTSNPAYLLSVNGKTSNAYAIFQNSGTGNTSSDGLLIGSKVSTQSAYFWNQENASIFFGTNNSGRMTIEAGGDVEINENLNVGKEVNRSSTGSSNLVPIAYGTIGSDGSIKTGTGNFSISNPSTGKYEISITSESYIYSNFVTSATAVSPTGFIKATSASGKLLIYTYDTSGSAVDMIFTFVVYKP